ncbi:MAG: phosphoesterase [Bacteroidetes bacterium]|nr:MAG: phosphoesterase [Bacteroidota bacterium]
MKRRTFIKGVLGLGAATALYTWQIEPRWVEVVQLPMLLRQLPRWWEGKTLMQISDLHVGRIVDQGFLLSALQRACQLKPDLVVYTGDFVSYESAEQYQQLESLMQQAVKGRLGTFAVLGNHDYGHRWSQPEVAARVCRILAAAGLRVLRNEQVQLRGLNLIGLDDYWGTNFRPQQVMPHIRQQQANVLLCHNPDVMDLPLWEGYKGWVLSGHTHGGQCKPPFVPPPILPVKNKRYTAGIFPFEDGRTLYINRALGYSRQLRFNVRPEITLFRLECGRAFVF